MTADRSLDHWLGHIRSVHLRSIEMGLDRVQTVLERLAAELPFKIIAVAGTNGKGSCAAMLGATLEASGYKAGVYTSPHLVRFNERIEIAGVPVEDAELCDAFEDIESLRGDVPLTYFEFATLAAVHVFLRSALDIAVMEVGMGGRLDAVNALPIDASLVTNVELDHMHWLGNDREAIGREKAHIMRAGRTSVFNGDHPPRSLLDYAAAIGTRLLVAGRDYHCEPARDGWLWRGPNGEAWTLESPRIAGAVQIANASGVLALLAGCPGIRVDRKAAVRGLRNARIRARCEIVSRDPMVVVDVAHNQSAVETLKSYVAANPVAGKTTAVFGMLRDKEPVGVVNAMNEHIDGWCLATIEDERGQRAAELADAVSRLMTGPVHCHDSAAEAYECAIGHSGPDDRVLAFGSFHIAGDILAHMTRPS